MKNVSAQSSAMTNFINFFENKNILIAGYGREGKSTLEVLSKFVDSKNISIADSNIELLANDDLRKTISTIFTGSEYLKYAYKFDIIIKSPGINLNSFSTEVLESGKITSQTEIFTRFFGNKIIGITGTKGKSTTTSLIYHIMKQMGKNVILAGNIGIPVFSHIGDNQVDYYILEMSSHQLENCKFSPHISILLNIYPEHLDHYNSFEDYANAKWQIAFHQNKDDFFITSEEVYRNYKKNISRVCSKTSIFSVNNMNKEVSESINFSENNFYYHNNSDNKKIAFNNEFVPLKGDHNKMNISAAYLACTKTGITDNQFIEALYTFKPLPHRMENVGTFRGIKFYNDSISTIPEACIAAVKSISDVDTLIVGGFDRGISYKSLIDFLNQSDISNIIVMGQVGQIIKAELKENRFGKNIFEAINITEAVKYAFEHTIAEKVCLLSPAASSYDQFKNFEDRGEQYKTAIAKLGK